MRTPRKVDANQADVVETLRAVGASVQSLAAVGDGCPDLLVGYRGVWYVIEVKDGSLEPARQLLNPEQKRWHAECKGRAHIAHNVIEALAIIGARRPDAQQAA